MCGFIIFSQRDGTDSVDKDLIRDMTNSMAHRGPDDESYYLEDSIGLGFRRLSIIDLETGNQPIHNENRKIWLVFNGEIYNFQTLREQLLAKGHSFYTKTDSEVVVHAYEEFGVDCVQHLNGMFAFAIWDRNREELFLARDRIGIKPLYFYCDPKRFIAASQISAILKCRSVAREVDSSCLSDLFVRRFVLPPKTLFKNIYKLPPGHFLRYRRDQVQVVRYWDIELGPETNETENEICEHLRHLLIDSVKMRLISDVPLGSFLSGGIDSSLAVAIASRLASGRFKTFSVTFEGSKYDESVFARKVADYYGTEHYEVVVRPHDIELLKSVVRYVDEPIFDPALIPTYMLSRLARKHVTVCLSGDGSDELFCGYGHYRRLWLYDKYSRYPNLLKERVLPSMYRVLSRLNSERWPRNFSVPDDNVALQLEPLVPTHRGKALINPSILPTDQDRLAFRDRVYQVLRCDILDHGSEFVRRLYFDLKYILPEVFLMRVDKMSMAHSLEVRVPFLDHRLVEYIYRLPINMRFKHGRFKHLLKRAFSDLLPAEIVERPKQTFYFDYQGWIKSTNVVPMLKQVFSKNGCVGRFEDYFNLNTVQEMLNKPRYDKEDGKMIFRLLMFYWWYEHSFMEK